MVLIFFKYYQPVCSEIESVDSVFFNTMPGTSINFYMPTVNFAFERKAYFVIEKFLLPGQQYFPALLLQAQEVKIKWRIVFSRLQVWAGYIIICLYHPIGIPV